MPQKSGSGGRIVFVLWTAVWGSGCFPSFGEHPQNLISQPAPVDDQNELPAYIKQCESVLGPIPEINCDPAHPAPGTVVSKIPVFVDGQLLAFTGDPSPAEQQLLAQRAASGNYECDFPSLGGLFPCTVGSTLVKYQAPDNPNVQWVGLCRGVLHDNPSYDRFIGDGLIGANLKTGEMCFFFDLNPTPEAPLVLPHLTSQHTTNAELLPWLPPKNMPGSCISCHPNNDPWILTPWLQPDYMRSVLQDPKYPLKLPPSVTVDDVLAGLIITTTPTALQLLLPAPPPAGRSAWSEGEILDAHGGVMVRQYRIVGSGYVSIEADGGPAPRTGMKPSTWSTNFRSRLRLKPSGDTCSNACHAMGNEHWINMAHDALGTKYSMFNSLQMSSGALAGHVWMPDQPGDRDLDDSGAYTIPAISECPIPKAVADAPTVTCQLGGVDVSWSYANDFGGVPGRDDIRFDVAILDSAGAATAVGASPSGAPEGIAMADAAGVAVLRDVAASDGTRYVVHVPTSASKRPQRLLLQPKRYCFEEPDRRPFAYAAPRVVDLSTCY